MKAHHLKPHYDALEEVLLKRGIMKDVTSITSFWKLGDSHGKCMLTGAAKRVASIDETRAVGSGKGESPGKGMGEAGGNGKSLTTVIMEVKLHRPWPVVF
jgi:hypothetical protein